MRAVEGGSEGVWRGRPANPTSGAVQCPNLERAERREAEIERGDWTLRGLRRLCNQAPRTRAAETISNPPRGRGVLVLFRFGPFLGGRWRVAGCRATSTKGPDPLLGVKHVVLCEALHGIMFYSSAIYRIIPCPLKSLNVGRPQVPKSPSAATASEATSPLPPKVLATNMQRLKFTRDGEKYMLWYFIENRNEETVKNIYLQYVLCPCRWSHLRRIKSYMDGDR